MPRPSAKTTPAKKSVAKKPARTRAAAKMSSRSIAKVKCPQCLVAKGKPHLDDCPNGHCVECASTLGHKLTCSHHPNFRGQVVDGKTGAVIDATVDGKSAKNRHDAAPPKKTRKKRVTDDDSESGEFLHVDDEDADDDADGIRRLAPPKLDDLTLFEALQFGLDKKVIFGIKQPLTKSKMCDEEWFDASSDQSVGCSAVAAFDFETLETCKNCKHTKKAVRGVKCIAHMALRISGELKDRQIDMFEDSR